MKKILACGSRGWSDAESILDQLELIQCLSGLLPRDLLLIHGGALGADTLAADAATRLGWQVQAVKADWEKYGMQAGYRRNLEMLNMEPDLVLAFWDGESRGTRHTIEQAKKRGINTLVVMMEGEFREGEQQP